MSNTEFNPNAAVGANGPTGPAANQARDLSLDASKSAGPTGPAEPAQAPVQAQAAKPAASVDKFTVIPGMADAMKDNIGLEGMALETKIILAKQPKVGFVVPVDPGEKAGVATRTVTINGYRFEIKKGVMVQLPQDVVTLLMDAYNYTAEALNDNEYNLANADERKRAALGL